MEWLDRHAIFHVGGIDEFLGGVDPWADENLQRFALGA